MKYTAYWMFGKGMLSKLMLAITRSTGHDLTINCNAAPGEIKFVPQLGPHEPQLLFQVVPAKVVVQTL